jgi:phospholipid/cholesterol/gamma-HCH transport system substrate-binding protein
MDERVIKFRVGVMVVAVVMIAGILVLLFGDAGSVVRSTYTIHMHFDDAPGVSEGTPVRKSGILIGRVTKVEFADQGGVNVTAHINGKVKLYRSEVPQISGSLLGGDVVIQFVRRGMQPNGARPPTAPPAKTPPATEPPPGDPPVEGAETKTSAQELAPEGPSIPSPPIPRADELVQDDDWIEGSVAPNAFQVITNLEGDLSAAISSLSSAGTEVGKLASYVNNLLENNDAQINRIVSKTEQTLDKFQKALDNVDDVIGNAEVRENLRQAIGELPQLLADTRGAMNTVRTTVESVDRNLRNLEGFTGPLGERGDEIVERVDRSLARLDGLLGEFSDFGKKLNSGEGSFGRLMKDPDLYQHLNAAAKNIEQITCQMQPILADARVFTDKIARHPELLGVRGAIQKSPGTK